MYDIIGYGWMIAFEQRTAAFARGMESLIEPGSVVLDIGCGPGILSFIACRAGAKKVYAVEPDDIIQLAQDTAADNGFADRVEFIQAMSTEIDLPEKVDGIVADVRGILPLEGQSIISILDARDRFAQAEWMYSPRRETMWSALVCCPTFHSSLVDTWDTSYQFDFSKARAQCANSFRGTRLTMDDSVVPPKPWAVVDYMQLHSQNVKGQMSWRIEKDVAAHGLCVWYDCETAEGAGFSNSPAANAPHVFRHAFFPWPERVELLAEDVVQIGLRADFIDPGYVWSWNTQVTSGSGQERARYAQSTFKAASVSHERLRKRAHSFVPLPREDSRIDRRVLELMDRCITLDEIAKVLMAEFPTRFKDRNLAITRVADLSEKYSG